ncbi:MAG: hypothetical protein K6E38_07785 [Fretibacterium sp.]|nr:hypothetical protein [Fretibacterium sp.]
MKKRKMKMPAFEKKFFDSKIILFIFCTIYIFLFCWLGIYACPAADDYNYAGSVSEQGFWMFQIRSYTHLNGRLLNAFLIALASLLPLQSLYWVFPIITVVSYIFSLCFFLHTFSPEITAKEIIFRSFIGTSCTLAVLPHLNETLYWRAGMPYFWTTALLILIASLAVRAFRGGYFAFWLCLFLAFLNGTILELPCVFQGIVAFIAALYFLWRGERSKAVMSGSFWLASVVAFFAVYLAPGTAVRMGELAQMPLFPHLLRTAAVASAFGFFTVIKFFIKPVVWALLLFLPVMAEKWPVFDKGLAVRVRAWHIVLLVILIAPLMQAIGGWAQGSGLELRGETLIVWMMGAVWMSLWVFGYRQEQMLDKIRSSRLFAWRWWLLILSLAVSFNFIDLIRDLKEAPHFAAESRARDVLTIQQRDAGRQNIILPGFETRPKLLFFNDLRPWPSYWVNDGFAHYYNVKNVFVLPQLLCEYPVALERICGGDPEPLEDFAEHWDVVMQFLMGEMYDPFFAGMVGVDKDPKRSTQWYEKAAEADSAQACRRLTRLYFLYDTSSEKYLKAFYWFVRSELSLLRL